MKHRFLLHSLSHRILVVDITDVAVPAGAMERHEKVTAPLVWFQGWRDAEGYFLSLGADGRLLEDALSLLKKTGTAALTITQSA